jgi:predicted ArsR family transcriptional regulator
MSIEMLSPKQKETAETIFKLTQQEHFPPTLDEIAAQMGITKGTLQYHISAGNNKVAQVTLAWETSAVSFMVDTQVDQKMEQFKNQF